jgi:maleylpyruvate isomerase
MPDAPDNYADPVTQTPPGAADPEAEAPQERVVGPVTAATERLIATAEALDDDAIRDPSLCSRWSRAHVLAHVARNADGLANLLTWANTGVETPMYASAAARNADIEAGAGKALPELVDDLRTSAAEFSAAVTAMPDDGWERQVHTGPAAAGAAVPARRILWLRLRELELHHVDLDAGYAPDDWPVPFVARALPESLKACDRRDEVPPFRVVVNGAQVGGTPGLSGDPSAPTVYGEAPAVLAWITGRSPGANLRVEPAVQLPALPPGSWL